MRGMSPAWLIAATQPADLPALAALEASAFPSPWTLAMLQLELEHPASILLTARVAAPPGPTAFAAATHPSASTVTHSDQEVAAYAAFRLGPGEGELLRIASARAARGQGAARELLYTGLALLRVAGCHQCHLEVRADNVAAIRLYERAGFERQGLRRNYYPDGTDAILFVSHLGGQPDAR
jgi:[ribosomal protein S18]-alanine N-acetyltransferase